MTRIYRKSEQPVMPWKNGRGMTREIYRFNHGPDMFLRVSTAEVSESGPFSDYAGFDRTLLNLGPGVMQLLKDGSLFASLSPLEICHFEGSAQLSCEITQTCRDINVFYAKDKYFASTFVRRISKPEFIPLSATQGALIYVLQGALVVHDKRQKEFFLQAEEALVREPTDSVPDDRWMIVPASNEDSLLALVAFNRA